LYQGDWLAFSLYLVEYQVALLSKEKIAREIEGRTTHIQMYLNFNAGTNP
jgi:hypothetical protein